MIYLIKETKQLKIVLDPLNAKLIEYSKNCSAGQFDGCYHNENMGRFPKRSNRGKAEIPFGYGVVFERKTEMEQFLRGVVS